MHRRLLALLPKAQGHSCHVIAVFLDIRGFTSFAGANESTDAAAFLRTMYLRILREYFSDDVLFFKPTGDGLMIIVGHPDDADAFRFRINDVLRTAVRLVDEFDQIADEDVMVNFEVPTSLGIGVARGSVTVLRSGTTTLDYTGRCLNLAARLMDLARPAGVVFCDKFGSTLLDDKLTELFEPQKAYIKGIAEARPLDVYVTRQWTTVPASAVTPLTSPSWAFDTSIVQVTVDELRGMPANKYAVSLSEEPADLDQVFLRVERSIIDANGTETGRIHWMDIPATYDLQPHGAVAVARTADILQRLEPLKLDGSLALRLQAKYLRKPVVPSTGTAV